MSDLGDQLLMATPGPGAFMSRPMDIGDIDCHPDAGRIWATIGLIQGASEEAVADAADTIAEERIEEAREKAIDDVEKAFKDARLRLSVVPGEADIPPTLAIEVEAGKEPEDISVSAILDDMLDKLAEDISDALGSAKDDLVNLQADREVARLRVEKLKDHISGLAIGEGLTHYERRVLRSGKPDAKLLGKLKKADLVEVTRVALALLYGRM